METGKQERCQQSMWHGHVVGYAAADHDGASGDETASHRVSRSHLQLHIDLRHDFAISPAKTDDDASNQELCLSQSSSPITFPFTRCSSTHSSSKSLLDALACDGRRALTLASDHSRAPVSHCFRVFLFALPSPNLSWPFVLLLASFAEQQVEQAWPASSVQLGIRVANNENSAFGAWINISLPRKESLNVNSYTHTQS